MYTYKEHTCSTAQLYYLAYRLFVTPFTNRINHSFRNWLVRSSS